MGSIGFDRLKSHRKAKQSHWKPLIEGSGNGKAQGEKTIRRGSRHLSEKCSRGRRGEQKQVFLPNKANRSFRINKRFGEEGKKATKKRNETTDRGVMQWLLAIATRLGDRRGGGRAGRGKKSTGLGANRSGRLEAGAGGRQDGRYLRQEKRAQGLAASARRRTGKNACRYLGQEKRAQALAASARRRTGRNACRYLGQEKRAQALAASARRRTGRNACRYLRQEKRAQAWGQTALAGWKPALEAGKLPAVLGEL